MANKKSNQKKNKNHSNTKGNSQNKAKSAETPKTEKKTAPVKNTPEKTSAAKKAPEKKQNAPENKAVPEKKRFNSKKVAAIVSAIVLLSGAGFAVYVIRNEKSNRIGDEPAVFEFNAASDDNTPYPDGWADIVIAAAEDASDQQLSEAAKVIETRMKNREFENTTVEINTAEKKINAHFEWKNKKGAFNPETEAISLRAKNDIFVMKGHGYDYTSMTPAGEKVFDLDMIADAQITRKVEDDGFYVYTFELTLDETGAEALMNASKDITDDAETPFSLWIDHNMENRKDAVNPMNDGVYRFHEKMSSDAAANDFLIQFSDGTLPIKMILDDYKSSEQEKSK